eukprot:scaffold15348_cov19-Prasinocladus_malaysianus.AAC.1
MQHVRRGSLTALSSWPKLLAMATPSCSKYTPTIPSEVHQEESFVSTWAVECTPSCKLDE